MVKQFLGYAIPSALAMCIASLNTIIDGVFLGNGIWISMAISEFMIILISKKIFNINKCTENAVTNLAS